MKRLLLATALLGFVLSCSRIPTAIRLKDVDVRVFRPVFEVQRTDPSAYRRVHLPYVASEKREVCNFSLEVSLPDSLDGWAVYLAVSVDDYAEVTASDSLVDKVYSLREVYLGTHTPGETIPVRLRCWALDEPTRLRGLTVIARPERHHRLREAERRFSRLLSLREETYSEWEWTRSDPAGAAWSQGGPGIQWTGRGSVAWFRTRLVKPSELNGFDTRRDSLWLRLAVDDSAILFLEGNPVAHFRRGGEVALPPEWQTGKPVDLRLKIINFRGPGRFVGAWLVSSRLTGLLPQVEDLLRTVRGVRLLLEQYPSAPPSWDEQFYSVARSLTELEGTQPRDPDDLGAWLERAERELSELRSRTETHPPFVCGPYLQDVGTDRIVVMWETPTACRGIVHFRPKTGGESGWKTVQESTARRIHEIRLTGLEADTEYEYWVQSHRAASSTYDFRTAPARRKLFRLAVWGDSRSDPYAHETVVLQMVRYRPDLAVNVGDVVGHGASLPQWVEMHFRPMRWLGATTPTYIAIGNHEYGGFWDLGRVPPFEEYVSQPGNEYYFSFNYAGSHFIILDSNREEDGIPLGREQFEWLKRDLASDSCRDADWRFVFFHHPPYSEGWDWGGYYDGEELFREKLVPLFARHRVTFVFSGHTHDYERGQSPKGSGPFYIITGGGGSELDNLIYRDWPEIDVQAFAYHFCLLEVDSTRIHFRAIRHDGSVLDEFTLTK